MLQRHSCWPWDGPTLQVPQPGQVPSAPAGFVPFLMSLLYLSYIHSGAHRPPQPPAHSQGNRNQRILTAALCVPPAQSSTRRFHVPHSSLPLHVMLFERVRPNLCCHCTSCISWLSLAHDLHKLLRNPLSVFLSHYWPSFQFLNLWWFPFITFITSNYVSTAVPDYDARWPLSHAEVPSAPPTLIPGRLSSDLWTWHLQEPLHYWSSKRFSFPATVFPAFCWLSWKSWERADMDRVLSGSFNALISPSPLLSFLQYFFFMQKEIYLSFWHLPRHLPWWTRRKTVTDFFFSFKQCPSINNPQQLLESFHRWSIIPLAHATFLIIYYNLFHSLPSISHHCLSCQFFYSLVRSAFAASGPSIITSLFLHAGRAAGAPRQATHHLRWENSKGGRTEKKYMQQNDKYMAITGIWHIRGRAAKTLCWLWISLTVSRQAYGSHFNSCMASLDQPSHISPSFHFILIWLFIELSTSFSQPEKNSLFPFLKLSFFLGTVVTNCRRGGLLVVLFSVFSMLFSPTVPCGSSLVFNSCTHLNSYRSKC